MSFLNFSGVDNIILNADPKISMFNNRIREFDIYNIDKAEKQNQVLPYINFDIEKKMFYPNNNSNYPVTKYEYDLSQLLLKHDMLGSIILTLNKYGSLDNTLNQIKKITLQIDQVEFSYNITQIKIHDKFIQKLIFDLGNTVIIKIPCRFFNEPRNYIPLFNTLPIKFIVDFKIGMIIGIECTVINLDEIESKKIKLYFNSFFDTIIDYQEFISKPIGLSDNIVNLTNNIYPIKEIFWFYSLNDNPNLKCKGAFAVDFVMEDPANYLKETKSYNQIQCTGTNPALYHGIIDPDIYMCSFCLEPTRQHPTGHLLTNGFNTKMIHHMSQEYAKHSLVLNMVIYQFVLIKFYKDFETNTIKCRLLKISELGKKI